MCYIIIIYKKNVGVILINVEAILYGGDFAVGRFDLVPIIFSHYSAFYQIIMFNLTMAVFETGVQISSRPWQPKCHLGDLKM